MQLGIEVLLKNKKDIQYLKSKKVALVAHPASLDHGLSHSLDLLQKAVKLSAVFGPQHGAKGEKQDNMIETDDEFHAAFGFPIFSLYGKVRRPTKEMMQTFDVLLYDLQDLGCRIYTFITTLLYLMEECAKYKKELWILDRPNPVGRPIEGLLLDKGFESFVGAAPMPMRYGLTAGELALWYKDHFKLDLNLKIIKMKNYSMDKGLGFGWPQGELSWTNPSPNAQTLFMARAYPGTVMIEGTTLSEGRGTTRALEILGAPDIDFKKILRRMEELAPGWLKGTILRECYFEPTFHKHQKKLCHGIQIHTDCASYNHEKFKPYRIVALVLKVIREFQPDYEIFRDFPYEYETSRLAFDVINGGESLRQWIEDQNQKPQDLENLLKRDETLWKKEIKKYYLYK